MSRSLQLRGHEAIAVNLDLLDSNWTDEGRWDAEVFTEFINCLFLLFFFFFVFLIKKSFLFVVIEKIEDQYDPMGIPIHSGMTGYDDYDDSLSDMSPTNIQMRQGFDYK